MPIENDSGIDVQTKQPGETVPVDMDFSRSMSIGETVTGIASHAFTRVSAPTGAPAPTLTMSVPSFSGQRAQAIFSLGADDEMYKVTIKVTTSVAGKVLEGEGFLRVSER